MRPIGRIVLAGLLLLAGQAAATPVMFPLRDLTGSDQVRQIILTPLDGPVVWEGVTHYSSTMYLNPVFGGATNALGQRVTGVTTNIIGGTWRVSYMGLPKASQIYIPFGLTNTISAADPAYQRLGIVQVFNITISTNGALLYDPVGKTMAQVIATNLYPYWHGKTTNNAWKFFNSDGYTLNTNCWTYPLDFSGLSAGALNVVGGDDVVLITPQHAITAAHAWAGTNGSPVVFTATNGTFFTNYVASFTQPIGMVDIMLVTFSNTAPAGINPFPLLPSNAASYLPTNLIGNQVIWLKNTPGQAGGPHMDLQLTDIGPALLGAATNPDPVNNPFYDATAIGGDSGGPVFTLISTSTGQLRPVFLYSLEHVWVAGPWVSYPAYLPAIQALIGTNQLQFVDLTRYQSTAPSLPPNGLVNLYSSQLPEAGLMGVHDYVMVIRENGSPSTQKESLENLLGSLEQLPNWPTNFQVVGTGGGSGTNLDIRPLTNTFTAPNTFNSSLTLNGSGNFFGAFQQIWSPLFVNNNAAVSGDLFVGLGRTLGYDIWGAETGPGGHTNYLFYSQNTRGAPVRIFAGTNMDNILNGAAGGVPRSVDIADGFIFADLSLASNPIVRFGGNQRFLGRNSSGAGVGEEVTMGQGLDWLGNTRGSVLERGLFGWTPIVPGTAGLPFLSQGTGADPGYGAIDLSGPGTTGNLAPGRLPAFTGGDATTPAGSGVITLNTVNSGVGTFGDSTHAPQVTLNAKGLATGASSVLITGTTPGGSAGGALRGSYPNPTMTYPVIYASPTGLTNNTGLSPDSPLPLPHALTVVGGGTLNILQDKGNYSGPYLDVVAANSGLTIQAYNYPFSQWGCNLLATNNASTIFIEPGVSNVTVQGLQLGSNTNQDGLKAQGVLNCTFRDNWFRDNTGNGLLSQDSYGNLIERNVFSGNGINNTNVNHIHGVYFSGTNIVVRGNVAFDQTNGYGGQCYGNAIPSNNVNCLVYENLWYRNSRGFTMAQDAGCTNFYFNNTCISNINTAEQFYGRSTSTLFASNNICENNGNGVLTSSGGNLIEDYNLVESAVSLPGTHDVVSADAGTVNGTKGLYWLTLGSAARGAAFNRPPPVDFYGYPQTSVSDIGAFQYYPHNWRSYDTRTLYRSSYPDYQSIFAFVPDTLPIPSGANATNLHVYLTGAPFAAKFNITLSSGQEGFRMLGDGTWAFTDKDNIQDLYFNGAYSLMVGTNITFTGTETNTTIKGPTPGLIGIDTAGGRYPVTNLVNLTLNLTAGSLTASTGGTITVAGTNTTITTGASTIDFWDSSGGIGWILTNRSGHIDVVPYLKATTTNNISGNAATATTATSATSATGATWSTNLQSQLGGSVVLSNMTSVTAQRFSTNASAQILSLDLSQPDALIIQTNTMQFTNVFNVPAANFAGRISRTIIGSGQAFVCNPLWHGVGTYSTNGGTLANGTHYQFSLKSDYVVSTNAYYWALVPANN